MKVLILLLLPYFLVGNRPPHKPVRWQLAQVRYLIGNCLDTVNVPSWHEGYLASSSYLYINGIKKEIIEQDSNKIIVYEITKSNLRKKVASGIYNNNNNKFLMSDVATNELYEKKVIAQSTRFLILSFQSGHLEIFFKDGCANDSLSKQEINKYMAMSIKMAGQHIKVCK